MVKIISSKEAADFVKSGMSIMVSGFLGGGAPHTIIQAVLDAGTDNLHLVSLETCTPKTPKGQMVKEKRFKKATVSHIGTNPHTGALMKSGELEVELVPFGTITERIRAKGGGLGGVLTPTGVGTLIEEGKQKITVDGREYLLELPLGADIAFIKAWKADKMGNLVFRKSARNINPIMAMAGDIVVAEVENIVEVGEIEPDDVMCPGLFIDYMVHAPA